MRRPLSRKQHGFVDYAVAAVELGLAALLPAKRKTRLLLAGSGLNAALLGALTKSELGLVKLIPMRAHLALDAVFAAVFLGAPAVLDERPSVQATLASLGASGATTALLTDPDRG